MADKKLTNEQILKNAESAYNWSSIAGIAGAIGSLASGFLGASTAKTYGRMQQRAAETQARLNKIATERDIAYKTRQTADQIADIKREGRQVMGSQLAAMAATGMSTASGSAQALLKSTGVSVGRDVSTLQANLQNYAFEQRRATNIANIGLQFQGQSAYSAGKQQAFSSIVEGFSGALSSAMYVADKWSRYQDAKTAYETKETSPYSPALSSSYNVDKNLGYQYDYGDGTGFSYFNASGTANDLLNFRLYTIDKKGKRK